MLARTSTTLPPSSTLSSASSRTTSTYALRRHCASPRADVCLQHVNRFTGIKLKDDPTIIGWETGNELSAARFGEGPPPAAWTREIARHVKALAPRHLVFDGTYGVFPDSGQLAVQEVDVFSDHFYPLDTTKFLTGFSHVQAADRIYLAGEIDWTGEHGGQSACSLFPCLRARAE